MLTSPKRLLEPEAILPLQFFATVRRDAPHKRGEYRLLVAVLEEAIACYQKYALSTHGRDRRAFDEVDQWIMNEPAAPVRKGACSFSFEQICGVLDLDPGYVRDGLQRWHATRAVAGTRGTTRQSLPELNRAMQDRPRVEEKTIPRGENPKLEKHLGILRMTNASLGTAVASETCRKRRIDRGERYVG